MSMVPDPYNTSNATAITQTSKLTLPAEPSLCPTSEQTLAARHIHGTGDLEKPENTNYKERLQQYKVANTARPLAIEEKSIGSSTI